MSDESQQLHNQKLLRQMRNPELRAKFERLIAEARSDIAMHNFDQLQYATPTKGEAFRFYLFDDRGFHRGGQWATSGTIRYPHDEITAHVARILIEAHMKHGGEVRVCDGGDMIIFHAIGERVLYPTNADDIASFWERV